MVFQPTSPVKTFATVQRAATVQREPKAEVSMLFSQGSYQGKMPESAPSDISQADAKLSRRLSVDILDVSCKNYRSWHRMSRLFQTSTEHLCTKNTLKKPNTNAPKDKSAGYGDSPTDPMYDPLTRTFRAELPVKKRSVIESRTSRENTEFPIDVALKGFRPSSPKVNMPPIAISGPDEPRSFLDLDSDDEESPVIERASSVRISKPLIIQYTCTSAAHVPKIGDNRSSKDKAAQFLGQDVRDLYLAAGSGHDSTGGPEDALRKLEGVKSVTGSNIALPPTPPSRTQPSQETIKATILEAPSRFPEITPTSDTGFKSPEASIVHSSGKSRGTPVFNPLRANPLFDTERKHTRLARTMSAPLLPNLNPNRRVTIRPADLIIHHTDNDKRIFREGVVTTPYPNRLSMINESSANRVSSISDEEQRLNAGRETLTALPEMHKVSPLLSSTPTSVEQKTPRGDRFQLPSQTEHLFLTLSLPPPSTATTTVEIEIEDQATFDDEQLFTHIRRAYLHQFLGLKRRIFFSSKISHVLSSSNDISLDGCGFLAHLKRPRLGRKKTNWLVWLRDQKPLFRRGSHLFSNHSPARQFYSGNGSEPSNVSASSSSKSITRNAVPHMSLSRHQTRDIPPGIVLYYRFSVSAVFLAMVLVVGLAVMSTLLWVMLGVTGQSIGGAVGEVSNVPVFGSTDWKTEAEIRVLTGLVLGSIVFVLGSVGVAGWCWGGYVLL